MCRRASKVVPVRLVPDTGFYIAAALQKGYARKYLLGNSNTFLTYQFFTSEAILLELQQKLEGRFAFDRPRTATILQMVRSVTSVVQPRVKLAVVRDPDDNKILECAVEAKALAVLSFDKDLLDLKEYEGIRMVHPAELKYWFTAAP